jgi:cell division protein FtsW
LAVWLNARKDKLSNIYFGLFPLACILGVLGGLIIVQPDLSAVVTIFAIGGLMFFLAGGEIRQIAVLLVVAVVFGVLVIQVHPTGSERIADYMSGLKDPTEGSYHMMRSVESFVNGGWFGVGIGRATAKVTGLPVPPTDSIFAVVGEEAGVFGASMLVFLYGLLLWRGLIIAKRAPDELGAMIAAGITIWICLEAFINMSVLVNLLPFAGNALPFISAGGSNLVASLAGVGILMNISRISIRKKEEKGKLFNAVIDLRRRDGRRSVSSARRTAGTEK